MSTKSEELQRKERVRLRWQILRHAIQHQTVLHNSGFPGFGLLKQSPATLEVPKDASSRLILDSKNLLESTVVCLLASMALYPNQLVHSFVVARAHDNNGETTLVELPSGMEQYVIQQCDLEACQITFQHDEQGNLSLFVHISSCRPSTASTLHDLHYYTYPSDPPHSVQILTRQRQQPKLTLQDLVTHRHTGGIDNTGSVRVWDAEPTLVWALQRAVFACSELVITELGSGHAALAALSLNKNARRIQITDGHSDSILHNQVHVQLMITVGLMDMCKQVDCRVLRWSTDWHIAQSLEPADVTLISDCTHFQRYHLALLWTMLQCTRMEGEIWMCQPNRTGSLSNFLNLVDELNRQGVSPLLNLQERQYDEILCRHNHFLSNCAEYDPDRHFPRIFVLRKLRLATREDHNWVLSKQ